PSPNPNSAAPESQLPSGKVGPRQSVPAFDPSSRYFQTEPAGIRVCWAVAGRMIAQKANTLRIKAFKDRIFIRLVERSGLIGLQQCTTSGKLSRIDCGKNWGTMPPSQAP